MKRKEHELELSLQEGYLEMAKQAAIREIFADIKNKRDACPIGGNVYHYLITPQDWQNFEQKYLERNGGS